MVLKSSSSKGLLSDHVQSTQPILVGAFSKVWEGNSFYLAASELGLVSLEATLCTPIIFLFLKQSLVKSFARLIRALALTIPKRYPAYLLRVAEGDSPAT